MSSGSDNFDSDLAQRVTRYVASANLRTAPSAVVGAVAGPAEAFRRWPRALPVAAVALLLAIGSVGIFGVLLRGSASGPAQAEVGGVTYHVVVDSTFSVEPAELSPYAPVTDSNYAWAFSEQEAYRLEGVDPRALLVVPAKPDAHEVEYLMLLGPVDPYPSACRYHDARAGEIPAECSGHDGDE